MSMDKGIDTRLTLRDNFAAKAQPGAMLDRRMQREQYQRYFREAIEDRNNAFAEAVIAAEARDTERATRLRKRVLQLNREARDFQQKIKDLEDNVG